MASLVERVEILEAHILALEEHVHCLDNRCNLACKTRFNFKRPNREDLLTDFEEPKE